MNRLVFYVPAFLGLVLGSMFLYVLWVDLDTETIPTPLLDKAVPEFSLPTVQSSEAIIQAADLKGQPYLLNVWATWCITCKVEHPVLNTLSEEGVRVVGLDYKDSRKDALDWLQQYGNPYLLNIYDEEGTFGFDLGVTGAPETFFIRSDGTIAYKHIGAINMQNWEAELKEIYETL